MNKRYSLNGHNIIDNTTGAVVASWSYDHAEFARTARIYRVMVHTHGTHSHTDDLDSLLAAWNR